jgi:hypothetical protein
MEQSADRREQSSDDLSDVAAPGNGGDPTADYGGLDQHFDQVDLDAAQEVGADPPGGLALDMGGGATEADSFDPDEDAAGA